MSVFKNISYFLAGSILAKPLGVLLSFALAKALGPADYGVWITLMLIISYCPIAHLGTLETLIKEVPYYLGKGDRARIHDIEDSVLGFVTISAAFVVCLALLSALVLPFLNLGVNPSLVVIMLLTAATTYYSSYYYFRSTAYENFRVAGAMDFLRSVLALLLVGGMVWRWGILGAVAGYFLHELLVFLVTRHLNIQSCGKVGLRFDRNLLSHAIRVGFPITLLWWVVTLSTTVDRIVMGHFLSPIDIGHYALGLSVVNILVVVPQVVGRVLYPKVNMQMGKGENLEAIKKIVLSPTLALGAVMVNIQLGILVAIPLLYNQLLPKYHPGIYAGQILMLGSFFACLLRMGANYLIAANHEKIFLKYIVVTLVVNIVVDVGLLEAGFGIEGIAFGTSLAGLLLTTLVWRRVLLQLEFTSKKVWQTLFDLYLPIIVLVGSLLSLLLIYPVAFQFFDGLTAVCGLGLLVVLNGLLYCFPIYREEMQHWLKTIQGKFRVYLHRAAVAKKSS